MLAALLAAAPWAGALGCTPERAARGQAASLGEPTASPPAALAARAARPVPRAPRPGPVPAPAPRTLPLVPGSREARALGPGGVDVYPVDLAAGQCLEAAFDQRGIDVVVDVLGPGRRPLFTVDGRSGAHGVERVFLVAETAGRYLLEVRYAASEPGGRYLGRLQSLHPAAERDYLRQAAEVALSDARRLAQADPVSWEVAAKLEEANRLFGQLGAAECQADALYRLGELEKRAGRHRDASDLLVRARALYRRLGDRRLVAVMDSEIGANEVAQGERGRALAAYRRALDEWQALPREEGQANTLDRLAELYVDAGKEGEALRTYRQEAVLWQALGGAGQAAATLAKISQRLRAVGDRQQALAADQQALALCRACGTAERAVLLTESADLFLDGGETRRALPLLDQAAALLGSGTDLAARARTLSDLGRAHRLAGDYEQALGAYEQALGIYRALGNGRGEAIVALNLGAAYRHQHRLRSAAGAYDRALRLARATGHRTAEAEALLGAGRVALEIGNPLAARRAGEAALAIVETLRAEVDRPEQRIGYLARNVEYYELLIEVLMQLHALDPGAGYDRRALGYSEQMRARGLLESLAARHAAPAAPPPAAPLPGAAELPAEIQRQLDDGTMLLEYAFGLSKTFLWAVTADSVASFELRGREQLEPLARSTYALLAHPQPAADEELAARQASELSRLLLAPVAQRLGSRRLLIVADGALQYLPFAALPDPANGGEPLMLNHEIANAPSLAVLAALRREEEEGRFDPAGSLALIADPVFGGGDERAHGLPAAPAGLDPLLAALPRLPRTRAEALAIAALAGHRQVLQAFGFAASRDLVLSGSLRRSCILHFATHGTLRADRPELAGLALSQLDRAGHPLDGWLRAGEIAGLDLPAELVVLSACDTALGRELAGEGLVGLPQAFMSAGAKRVLVSLWDVGDRSTAELMTRFYRGLLTGRQAPAAALCAAQRAMWRDARWHAPSCWSGFVLLGDWRWGPQAATTP